MAIHAGVTSRRTSQTDLERICVKGFMPGLQFTVIAVQPGFTPPGTTPCKVVLVPWQPLHR